MCPETCKGCNNVNGSCDKGCHPGWRGGRGYCGIGRLTHRAIMERHMHGTQLAMLMVSVIKDVSNVIVSADLEDFNSVNIAITIHLFTWRSDLSFNSETVHIILTILFCFVITCLSKFNNIFLDKNVSVNDKLKCSHMFFKLYSIRKYEYCLENCYVVGVR